MFQNLSNEIKFNQILPCLIEIFNFICIFMYEKLGFLKDQVETAGKQAVQKAFIAPAVGRRK